MKKLFLLLVMVFALAACNDDKETSSGGGGNKQDEQQNQQTSQESDQKDDGKDFHEMILAAGDSITSGWQLSVAYPDIVQSRTGIPTTNLSSPGISAEQIASNAVNYIATKGAPRYVIALMGTNNAANGAGGGVEGAINAAKYLAQVCNELGITLVLGTLPKIYISSSKDAKSLAISNAIRGISGTRIAEIRAAVPRSDYFDDLHPNEAGQRKIAEAFIPHIR